MQVYIINLLGSNAYLLIFMEIIADALFLQISICLMNDGRSVLFLGTISLSFDYK